MNRKFIVVAAGLLLVLLMAAWSHAGGMFVATAKNARGALYQGFGPTPGHASGIGHRQVLPGFLYTAKLQSGMC